MQKPPVHNPKPVPTPARKPVRAQLGAPMRGGHPASVAAALAQRPSSRQHPVDVGGKGTLKSPYTDPMVKASVPGMAPPSAPAAAPGINPYTGKPLGANEYVGVAGSEAEHPGQTRIPTPGWWNPSNPNYERRDYWISPTGEIVANEAGFQANPDHPFDTGREGERNSEFGARGGYQHVAMSQPGVPTWGPGGQRPDLASLPTSGARRPDGHLDRGVLAALTGSGPRTSPTGLDALLAGRGQSQQYAQALLAYIRQLRAAQQGLQPVNP